MDSISNPDLVTPALTYDTGIPVTDNVDETIIASLVSEFKQHSIPATAVDATHKICTALDGHDQPMVFSIGNDSRLYCVRHVSGDRWTTLDITPTDAGDDATVSTFDVFQHNSGKVAVSAAVLSDDSTYPHLYYAKPIDVKATTFNPSDISFVKIKDNSCLISCLAIAASDTTLTKPCFIIVGTQGSDSKRGTDYNVSTDPNNSDPWTAVSLPDQANAILKVIPVTQRKPIYGCAASLYKKNLSSSSSDLDADVGGAISCLSFNGKYNIYILLDKLSKGARDISTTTTSKGLSDLYVAGVKGIGYYASELMDQDPTVMLPDIAFKQIIASEKNLKVSVLATSTNGGLYYIEGARDSSGVVPTFTASGYPIRQDIGIISTQYNAAINACEVMYVTTDNQLGHIWRDPGTKLWSEQKIHVADIDKIVSFPAFVSQMHLKGNAGATIMDGREVILSSSEVTYIHVNEKSYRLDSNPTSFNLDVTGYLHIVVQARDRLAAPTITATIGTTTQYSITIEPRQRLLRQWSKISTGDDVKNARSTARVPVFPNTDIDDSTFSTTATVLSKVPLLVAAIDPSASPMTGSDATSTDMSLTSQRSDNSLSISSDNSWMQDAKDLADDVGDFLQWVWSGVETVIRFGIKVIAGVVNFFAEIGGKVLRFTLNAIGTLIRAVSIFLKDALGIDITRFLALYGFVWDYDNILKTQQIIVKSAVRGGHVLAQMLKAQSSTLKQYIRDARIFMSLWVPPVDASTNTNISDVKAIMDIVEKSPIGQLLGHIIHNPILQDVLRYASLWLAKIVSLLDDVIVFPGLQDLQDLIADTMIKILDELATDESDDFTNMFQGVYNQIVNLISGSGSIGDVLSVLFSDAFWSIFDAAEDVIMALIDIFPDIMTCAIKILTSPITLPGTSAFWESFTGTPFSFVDVGSMIVAQVTYLITMTWKEKLPFEVMDPWYDMLPRDGSTIDLSSNIEEYYGNRRSTNNQFTKLNEDSQRERVSHISKESSSKSNPPVPGPEYMNVWLDLMLNFCVSIGTFGASMCTLWGDIQRVGDNVAPLGYETVPNPPSQVNAPGEPTEAGKLAFQTGETMFGVFGWVFEASTLLSLGHLPTDPHSKYFTTFTRVTAICVKSFSLTAQIANHGTIWTDMATPLANIFNSLPTGICCYKDSEGNTPDKVALGVSMMNAAAGGCDVVTMALCQWKLEDIKMFPFAASASLNGLQASFALYYGIKYAFSPGDGEEGS